ncbi:MAG: nitroreductase family protein [Porticoccaceae bacterium]|nr:nitroreductase family protein [Porticoccaceae bacterium]
MTVENNQGEEFVELMSQRRSHPRVEEPAPSDDLMQDIFAASLRAPDHMHLRPWRFLVIRGDDRQYLADLFVKDCQEKNCNADSATLEGAKKKAYRAPLIVVGITSYKSHDKVPEIEQALATGGVLNNIGMAIYAHGFGSVWRTGGYASSSVVREGLGVSSTEEIVGYLYIGTPTNADRPIKPIEASDFFMAWPEKYKSNEPLDRVERDY